MNDNEINMSVNDKNDQNSSTFVQELTEIMKKLPEIKEDQLGVNPFTQELVIEVTRMPEKEKYVKDGVNEYGDPLLVPASMLIEKQKAMRVYRVAGAKERAMNLSAGALRMFVYLQYTVQAGKDWVQMTPEQYERSAQKGSRNVYKKAVEELWRYGYINPTVQKNVYWVNPALMYCGNRITKWSEKVVIKNEIE